ncbi:putative S-layer protein [Candidatus Woesearchaeota archaeon]|nr:putative S-layer protein [Candidatus Woesearchaeota archaeon]
MSKKFIISLFTVLFLGLTLVSAADLSGLTISPSPATIIGLPGENKAVTVQFTNNGGTTLTNLVISKVDLIGQNPTNLHKILLSQINVNPTSFTLNNGQQQNVAISLIIPTGLNADTYKGTFSIGDGVNSKNFDVLVTIQPQQNFEILTFTETTPLVISGQEDSSVSGTFSVRNTGSSVLTFDQTTSYDIGGLDLSDTKRTITLSFPSTFTVAPGETKGVVINANVPANIDIDTYDGILKVISGSIQKSFKLEIKIHPELCKDGVIGDFSIDIDQPDSGDEFAPGETIDIQVNVGNDFDKNIKDIVVKAFLYDVDEDDKVEEVESDPEDIDEGDDKDFDLSLEVPEDITADDEFILFVKGFEDGNEDEHCAESQVSVDIQREKHDVIIPKNGVQVQPTTTVRQGESFDVSVKALNVGESDEDGVTVKINIPELGISETSPQPFDLEDGESDDNEQIVRFSNLKVPNDAKIKTYSIEATVTFDDGDATNTGFGEVTVIEGEQSVVTEPIDVLNVQSATETTTNTFDVRAILTNDLEESVVYTVEGSASWANLVNPQIISLREGESKPIQFTFVGKEGLEAGSYSGNLIVKDNKGTIVESDSFTVAATGVKKDTTGITGFTVFEGISGSTVLFVIGDIVLVIIAIFFIKMIFSSGKRKRDNMMMPPPGKIEKVKL